MNIGRMLNTSVTIWRATSVPDGAGGETTTLAQVGTARAMVSQPSVNDRLLAAQGQSNHTHVVHMPPGTDVRRNDELRRDDQVFRVWSVMEPSRAIYVRADAELIQHG